MIRGILQLMLGSPGRAIVDFLNTHTLFTTIALAGCLLLYQARRYQLYRISKGIKDSR